MLAHRRSVWLCVLLVMLAGGLPASVQAPSLSGAVTDTSGAALPGVSITITRPSMKDVVAVSDEHGRFHVRTSAWTQTVAPTEHVFERARRVPRGQLVRAAHRS
jgi:hypothetical protein